MAHKTEGTEYMVCPCDPSRTIVALEARLRQMELTLSAKVKEAVDKPTSFWLGTSGGQLLWNMLSGLLLMWLVHVTCKLNDILGFARALRKIQLYLLCKKVQLAQLGTPGTSAASAAAAPSPGETDLLRQSAIVLSRHGASNCDVESQQLVVLQEERRLRQTFRSFLKSLISSRPPSGKSTIIHEQFSAHCASTPASPILPDDPSTIHQPPPTKCNMRVPISVLLPEITLAHDRAMDFRRQARQILDPLESDLHPLQSGSTFLHATVTMAASASTFVEDLLKRAIRLVKMATEFDPACTVQLGGTALLYMGPGNNVEQKLLKKGVDDIPLITFAQHFKQRTFVIKGLYLKDTEIIADISYGKSVNLKVHFYEKMENGLEILIAQLPEGESLGERTLVHANKKIQIDGHTQSFIIRSESKEVEIFNESSRMVGIMYTRRFWICMMTTYIYQYIVLPPSSFVSKETIFYLMMAFVGCFLVEYLAGPWIFDIIIRCLERIVQFTEFEHITNLVDLLTRMVPKIPKSSNVLQDIMRDVNVNSSGSSDDDSNDESDEESCNDDSSVSNEEGAVNELDWEWPRYDRFKRKGRWVTERVKGVQNIESAQQHELHPFKIVTTTYDNGSQDVELIVTSPLLIEVLKTCQPKTDHHFTTGSSINPREIFFRRESLRAYTSSHANQTTLAHDMLVNGALQSVWYAKHLLRFAERHFAEELAQYERMQAKGCVSFAMLWAFLVPGEAVCRRCLVTNQECFATVIRTYLDRDGNWRIALNVMDFNVQSYHRCAIKYTISPFEGEVPFTSLQVCPLQYFPRRKDMEARFLFVGNVFYEVAMRQPCQFMQFKGSICFFKYENGCWRASKLNSDGRVMIDLLSFARMNPDYPLNNAEPPCNVMTGLLKPEYPTKKPADEELMMAPAFAYGFSFRIKKWGCFELCGLQDIKFNPGAFEALRMRDKEQKSLLWSVVQNYTTTWSAASGYSGSMQSEAQSLDPIANKGEGCIMLCHGPPGTGKTLTAEAMAEELQCPLWAVSAFELGEEPERVENMLSQIMEISHHWKAILLLDEADGYLERRGERMDVKRNLLTGVFLRLLEYYQGIMFLSTNRVTAFDDAILSRTTLAISYPALDETQRLEIWETLLGRAGIDHLHHDDYADLVRHDLNGRQIRNIVHLAQLLARGRKEHLHITHIRSALLVFLAGFKHLALPPSPTST